MELTYTSVTKFYVDLKAHLLRSGFTVERTVVPNTDIIFNTGSGFFRLKYATVSESTCAVGWAFGSDADLLAVETIDAEAFMPFASTPGAEFVPSFGWDAARQFMSFFVSGNSGGPTHGSCYRINIYFAEKTFHVQHTDRFRPQYEPNFKHTGGAYIPAGA